MPQTSRDRRHWGISNRNCGGGRERWARRLRLVRPYDVQHLHHSHRAPFARDLVLLSGPPSVFDIDDVVLLHSFVPRRPQRYAKRSNGTWFRTAANNGAFQSRSTSRQEPWSSFATSQINSSVNWMPRGTAGPGPSASGRQPRVLCRTHGTLGP